MIESLFRKQSEDLMTLSKIPNVNYKDCKVLSLPEWPRPSMWPTSWVATCTRLLNPLRFFVLHFSSISKCAWPAVGKKAEIFVDENSKKIVWNIQKKEASYHEPIRPQVHQMRVHDHIHDFFAEMRCWGHLLTFLTSAGASDYVQ